MTSLRDLDGATVSARALGWDGSESDGTDFSLSRGDLPRLVNLIGTLTVTYVDDLDYTQFVVNGIPVDYRTIIPVDYTQFDVLVADGWQKVARDPDGKWTSGPGGSKAGLVDYSGLAPVKDPFGTAVYSKELVQEKVLKGIYTVAEGDKMLAALTAKYDKAKQDAINSAKKPMGPPALSPGQKAAATKKANQEVMADLAAGKITDGEAFNKLVTINGNSGDKALAVLKKAPKAANAVLDDLSAGNITGHEALVKLTALNGGDKAAALQVLAGAHGPIPTVDAAPASAPAPSAAELNKSLADSALGAYVKNVAESSSKPGEGLPIPSEFMLTHASDSVIDDYLVQQMSKKSYDAIGTKDKHELAKIIAEQHRSDLDMIAGLGPYANSSVAATAVAARRLVLRETGARSPTGGLMEVGARKFYGDAAIMGMSPEKQKAIAAFHNGVSPSFFDGYSPEQVAVAAVKADKNYKLQIESMQASGQDMSIVPHSYVSAVALAFHQGSGLPTKPASVSNVVTSSPLPVGKPGNWDSLSPGKKAAWTKKNKAGIAAAVQAMHPADWESMSPGKKAAWTKKNNLGGASTTSPAGKHETFTFASAGAAFAAASKAANYVGAPASDIDHHYARYGDFSKALKAKNPSGFAAWKDYTGGGSSAINVSMKKGHPTAGAKHLAEVEKDSSIMTAAPVRLIRGKSSGGLPDLEYKVGQEFVDNKFGSFSLKSGRAKQFAGLGSNSGATRSVITRIVNSHGVPSIPGTDYEYETIMPPGTRYRVVGIKDYISSQSQSYSGSTKGVHLRVMDVEVIP